jgi:hypothetical protein
MTINKPAHPTELLCRGGRERLVFLQFFKCRRPGSTAGLQGRAT